MAIGSFDNPITGGGGALTINQIKSPNFNETTKTGWCIRKDGSAFFYNITSTGDLFIYDGAAGPGTLLLAITEASGSDEFGNPYSGPGISLSVPGIGQTKNNIQIRPDLGAILIYE